MVVNVQIVQRVTKAKAKMVPVFVAASQAKSRIIARTKFFSKNSESPQFRFSKFDTNLPIALNFVNQLS